MTIKNRLTRLEGATQPQAADPEIRDPWSERLYQQLMGRIEARAEAEPAGDSQPCQMPEWIREYLALPENQARDDIYIRILRKLFG